MDVEFLFEGVKNIIKSRSQDTLRSICNFLHENVHHYDWVGFYFMNDNEQKLELGPYSGNKTDHTSIPYGKGICGQVAVSGETFVVQDVEQEDNYIACSIETKSEIVVPIYKNEKLVGQIDIDSHSASPFTSIDEELLNRICSMIIENELL